MIHFFLWLVVAICLDNAQFRLTSNSYKNEFCTFGAIDNIQNRIALAPMAYRVLIPGTLWITDHLGLRRYRVAVYEILKIASMVFALSVVEYALGLDRALLVAAILPVTFLFDYTDCYFELAAFASALSGNLGLTIISTVFVSFERETAPLVPITFWMVTGDSYHSLGLLALSCLIMYIVRFIVVGYRPPYCERFMYKRNQKDLIQWFKKPFQLMFLDHRILSLGLSIMVVWYVYSGKITVAPILPLFLIVLDYACGIASETRIFIPIFLWLAMGMIK